MLILSLGPALIITAIVLAATLTQLASFSARLDETEEHLRTDVVGRALTGAAGDSAVVIDNYLLERISDIRRWSEDSAIIAAARQGTLTAEQAGWAGLPVVEIRAKLSDRRFVPIPQEVFAPALAFLFRQTERPETPFVEILVTEAHSINVISTRPVAELVHSDDTWWQAASAQNGAGIGVTDLARDGADPVIGLALPIIDPDNKEVLGVIRATLRLTDLQQRLSQKAASLNAELSVYAHDMRLIADTASRHNPALIMSVPDAAQRYAIVLDAPTGQSEATETGFRLVDDANGRYIVGYARTAGSGYYDAPAQLSGFPGFGWQVIVVQPEQQAFQVLSGLIDAREQFAQMPNMLASLFGVVLVLAIAVSLVGAIIISGSISRPLIAISRAAQCVQNGNLAVRVDVQSNDEVGLLAQAFNAMTAGLRERERERDIFGRVVSPEVRERLLNGELRLGGETLWVAVLFTDIRGFSTMAEQMHPEEVITFLNEYLTIMADAVRPWGGYINNFIGDAIVVVFGAPVDQIDKEWHAVAAALDMQDRLAELNQQRIARGALPIHNGIGISTGEAVAGQIGSLERLMYTVIGDTVNVAARLETLTKDYPEHPILINGDTARALEPRSDLILKNLGPMHVKGRTHTVDVYAVIGWLKQDSTAPPQD